MNSELTLNCLNNNNELSMLTVARSAPPDLGSEISEISDDLQLTDVVSSVDDVQESEVSSTSDKPESGDLPTNTASSSDNSQSSQTQTPADRYV